METGKNERETPRNFYLSILIRKREDISTPAVRIVHSWMMVPFFLLSLSWIPRRSSYVAQSSPLTRGYLTLIQPGTFARLVT